MRKIAQGLVALVVMAGLLSPVFANEFTDVIDAFDTENNDPFDVNLSVGYEHQLKKALIRREDLANVDPHKWDYFPYKDVADFKQKIHILNLDLEVGLFKDLSLRVGLPIILNDSRELTAADGFNPASDWADVFGNDQVGDAIFTLPFKSPERSGVDYLAVGLWWGVLDQGRDDTKPNWTLFAEGRFGIGDELKAAKKGEDGGISRGLNEFHFGTRLSRRYGMLDPYFGVDAMFSWPKDGTAFNLKGSTLSQINDMPPIVGTLDFGLEVVPWEVPDAYRKLSIGVGGGAQYHSEGRDYTPLFDALGRSDFFLASDYYVDFNGNGTNDGGVEDEATDGEWTGMADIENYATFFGKLFVMIQPAKYIKFRVGTLFGHDTEHFITKTDECAAGNIRRTSTGNVCDPYNLAHRPEIDSPGRRFRAEKTFLFDFFIDATAMF